MTICIHPDCHAPATGEVADYSATPVEMVPVCAVHAGPQADEE